MLCRRVHFIFFLKPISLLRKIRRLKETTTTRLSLRMLRRRRAIPTAAGLRRRRWRRRATASRIRRMRSARRRRLRRLSGLRRQRLATSPGCHTSFRKLKSPPRVLGTAICSSRDQGGNSIDKILRPSFGPNLSPSFGPNYACKSTIKKC